MCEVDAQATRLGVWYADVEVGHTQRAPIRFTFLWIDVGKWEGRDYVVPVGPAPEESERR